MESGEVETTIEYVPSTEGWELALTRHKPVEFNQDRPPVLLCHGFASNRYDLDFDGEYDKYSLARYLAGRGFDAWVLELRGHGRSRKESLRGWFTWNFDTYAKHDAPDAVDFIRSRYLEEEETSTRVFWVGHSMGGMIGYAYGSSKEGQRNLKGVVTVASSVQFDGLRANLRHSRLQWLIKAIERWCPSRVNRPFFTPFYLDMNWSKNILEQFFVNKDNIDLDILDKFWERGIEVISCKKLFQFAYMLETEDFCQFPNYPRLCRLFRSTPLQPLFCPNSYTKELKNFDAPLLAIAGEADKVGVKDDVFKVKELAGSSDITLKLLSEEEGHTADYGHLDLVLGFNAQTEVFEEIYDWLMEHS